MNNRRDQVVIQAYAATGALRRPCDTCGSQPNQWCTTPDGRLRRVPCVDRAAAGATVDDDGKPRDFSEPTHGRPAL